MWEKVKLFDICKPKQWKTISTKDLKSSGYPVYGANGKIGFYSNFTHEISTLTITCRGATCGSLHITEPKSYINGNAMALDNLNKGVHIKYLFYVLKIRGFSDIISGSAQPQITREGLEKVEIPLPPLPIQEKIAAILDKADELRRKDKDLQAKYDELAQAIFIDMFGDPVRNEKGWEVKKIISLLTSIENGWSPVCDNNSRSNQTEWAVLKLGAISYGEYKEFENKIFNGNLPFSKISNEVQKGDLLFVRKNTYDLVGKTVYISDTAPKLLIPDTIFRLRYIREIVNPVFLAFLINNKKVLKGIQSYASGTSGSMPNISKSKLLDFSLVVPPLHLQEAFAKKIELINQLKAQINAEKSEELFQSLLQKAFKGELVS